MFTLSVPGVHVVALPLFGNHLPANGARQQNMHRDHVVFQVIIRAEYQAALVTGNTLVGVVHLHVGLHALGGSSAHVTHLRLCWLLARIFQI